MSELISLFKEYGYLAVVLFILLQILTVLLDVLRKYLLKKLSSDDIKKLDVSDLDAEKEIVQYKMVLEKELETYDNLGKKLNELRESFLKLRPVLDTGNIKDANVQKLRYGKLVNTYNAAITFLNENRTNINPSIKAICMELMDIALTELIQFEGYMAAEQVASNRDFYREGERNRALFEELLQKLQNAIIDRKWPKNIQQK